MFKNGVINLKFSSNVMEQATKIALECQGHQHAPCSTSCPMHTEAIEYVNLIKEGKTKEALLKIREKLFLPATLGRICAHPCELECRRCKEYDEPIAIAALKRYVADREDNENLWDLSKENPTGKKIAIIGAGPAGAQAAIDLIKTGHNVTIFEKLNFYGGMMRVGIPAYRLPRKVIDFEYRYLEKLGVEFKMGVEIGKDITFKELQQSYDAVVVANGAHKGSLIPTKGDDNKNITNAVDFLKLASLEERADVTCKKVVVVGGGDVAMDCARTALRLGASEVNLVSLEGADILPASKHEQHGALAEGVIFNCACSVKEILGDNGLVSGAVIRDVVSIFDNEGKFNPVYNEENLRNINCDTIIFATGQVVQDVTDGIIEQMRGGRYVADKDTLQTSVENVFVAGDCSGTNIVVQAMASGRRAALSVNLYLQGEDLRKNRDFEKEGSYKTKLDVPLPKNAENLPRKTTNEMQVIERIKTFDECDFGFDDETALAEASRCFKCECKKCMVECIMLSEYALYPGDLFKTFISTSQIDPIIPYSCNMCDQCTLVCPEEYKFAELFGAMRKDMVKCNGGNSPMAGHKAINMHQLLGFSKIFTTKVKGGKNNG